MNALTQQVGGTHYKKMAIQPMEFSMANRLDACAHTALKYISRHQDKAGRDDLEKALHCIELREETATGIHIIGGWVIEMDAYCQANGIPPEETDVLCSLAAWLESHRPQHLLVLKGQLRELIELRYPAHRVDTAG